MIDHFTEIGPGGQADHRQFIPLMLTPADTQLQLDQLLATIVAARAHLLDQLAQRGAVVLRGLPLANDQDFDRLIRAFALPNFAYADSLSNAVRRNRTDRVFTANEAPASVEINLHHEMAQTPVFPGRLFFFCEQAPASGGTTPLCRSDVLLDAMRASQPDFVSQCAARGLRYTNVMPAVADPGSGQGRSWQSTLGAVSRNTAEEKLRRLGYSWCWLEDGNLKVTTPVLPAIRRTRDGREVFFNQLIAAFKGWRDTRNATQKSVCFGSGADIKESDLAVTSELADGLTFDLDWHAGDVALVDNFLVMHGRRPFTGSRIVLASLVAATNR